MYIARIENEKGEKQEFTGDSPAEVISALAVGHTLKGNFSLTLVRKILGNEIILLETKPKEWRKPEEMPSIIGEMLLLANCLECPILPICPTYYAHLA
jgi:hypothetical protein